MDPIQEAIEEIESCEADDDFSYRQIAKQYGVVRSTLQRRHRDQMRTRELTHLALNPQHEYELV